MLKLTSLCNAGIRIEYAGCSLLVDGICQDFRGFDGLSQPLFEEMLHGSGPYASLSGVFFTHCHPDHFDPQRVELLRNVHPECTFFIPDEKTFFRGRIQCGPFSVSYYETPHMPQDFAQVRHFVLLITAGTETVYIAADAVLDAACHRTILEGCQPTYVFVNPVYLAVEETRQLLEALHPRRLFVYHIPSDLSNRNSMRRKAERSVERYCSTLPPTVLTSTYPMRLQ